MIKVGNQKLQLATVRDMSVLIELEKSRNQSKFKTLAFAQAAHEFRNPLNGILSSLELLADQVDPQNKYLQIANSCANNMLFLVNDILDYS